MGNHYGEFHLVVGIILVNKKGQSLITKRHSNKNYGGKWEWQGGSVVAGENSLEGAIRELAEESGITVEKNEIVYKGSVTVPYSHTIYDSYFAQRDFSHEDITLQDGETVDYKLASFNDIHEMIQNGQFLDFLYYRHRVTWGEELNFFAKLY